jgi:hypothetical protein
MQLGQLRPYRDSAMDSYGKLAEVIDSGRLQ